MLEAAACKDQFIYISFTISILLDLGLLLKVKKLNLCPTPDNSFNRFCVGLGRRKNFSLRGQFSENSAVGFGNLNLSNLENDLPGSHGRYPLVILFADFRRRLMQHWISQADRRQILSPCLKMF